MKPELQSESAIKNWRCRICGSYANEPCFTQDGDILRIKHPQRYQLRTDAGRYPGARFSVSGRPDHGLPGRADPTFPRLKVEDYEGLNYAELDRSDWDAERKAGVQAGKKPNTSGVGEIQTATQRRGQPGESALEGVQASGEPIAPEANTSGVGGIRKFAAEHEQEIADARQALKIQLRAAGVASPQTDKKFAAIASNAIEAGVPDGYEYYGPPGLCIYTRLPATSIDHVPPRSWVAQRPDYGGMKLLVPADLKLNLHKHTFRAECLLMIALACENRLYKAVEKRSDAGAAILLKNLSSVWLNGAAPTDFPCPCVKCRSVDYATRREQLRQPWALKIIETPVPR